MAEEQSLMPWGAPPTPFVETLPFEHGFRAARQAKLLDDNRHPLTGERIARLEPRNRFSPPIGTCGECAHLIRRHVGERFGRAGVPKCELHETSDVRSDVTLKWPSCPRFERKESPL